MRYLLEGTIRVFFFVSLVNLVATSGFGSVLSDPTFVPLVAENLCDRFPNSKSAVKLRRDLALIDESFGCAQDFERFYLEDEVCAICTYGEEDEEAIRLACGCIVHEDCVLLGLKSHLADGNIAKLRTCPGCGSLIKAGGLGQFLDEKMHISLQRLYARRHPKIVSCPQCDGGMAIKPRRRKSWASCINCDNQMCFDCQMPPHRGLSCDERDDGEEKFRLFTEIASSARDRNKYRICPRCDNLLDKRDGCDTIFCGKNARDKAFIGSHFGRGCGAQLYWSSLPSLIEFIAKNYVDWAEAHWKICFPGRVFSSSKMLVQQRDLDGNLRSATIKSVTLGQEDFEQFDFSQSTMRDTAFYGTKLRGADFNKTRLFSVRFVSRADLEDIQMSHAVLDHCKFGSDVKLHGGNFQGTSFIRSTVKSGRHLRAIADGGGLLSGLIVRDVKLSTRDVENLDLTGVRFLHVDATHVDFTNTILGENTFKGTRLLKRQFEQALMSGNRDFRDAIFEGVNFSHVDMRKLNLRRANFSSANFKHVSLQGSDIRDADFRGARGLTRKQLKAANNWHRALYDEKNLAKFNVFERHLIKNFRKMAR